ncbi:hypothetical protein HOK51_00910 [Candidatus Woesearchaeota archaeon]|jgi:flagellin-like protein|nr:hypothetical protein [Candidatus Woesearchaeota archaeon]MBT6518375.1 hypothetical protein [Candidatus Woesearchaeota archaeon]MBT7368736.1 hypothetical protein [Candidatus Woesearchaeota archaeon]
MKLRNMFKDKKGVSPLIATVLLIAFAVALGAVVMNWGRGYVEDTAETAKERSDAELVCASEIDLGVVAIDGITQVCYNATGSSATVGTIELIIENQGKRTVQNISYRFYGSGSRAPVSGYVSNPQLTSKQAKWLNFTYNVTDYGTPVQVELMPMVRIGSEMATCSGSKLTFSDIDTCSIVWT